MNSVVWQVLLAVVAERNPLAPDYVANIMKYLPVLRSKAFGLHEAAAYLEAWVLGSLPKRPLLCLDARFGCNHISCE